MTKIQLKMALYDDSYERVSISRAFQRSSKPAGNRFYYSPAGSSDA
jgi:hypothetical protein